jgi:GNAT superfamily N-acetyltransferase
MAPSVRVRPLEPADVPRFLDLVDALADYERLPRPDADARRRLAADATSQPPRFRTLLGELDGEPVGYAVTFFTYSTFLARPTLYLEDLFVRPEARGAGVGLALFRACAREAVRHGCARYEWQVLGWNEPAKRFYERLGAHHNADWLPYRLDGEALAAVAAAAEVG